MKKLLINLLLLMGALYGHAQSNGSLSQTMDLKNCDTTKIYTVDIKKGTKEIKLSAEGHLSAGYLSFIVFDPEGKRETGFDISADSDSKPEKGRTITKGRTTATYENTTPLIGLWKIKLITTNATGSFNYKLNFN
jgi:hypothetical protein